MYKIIEIVDNLAHDQHRNICIGKIGKFPDQSSVRYITEFRGRRIDGFRQFWVGRPKSVFGLNVLAGARKMQVASNLIIVTLFSQRCDFAHLPTFKTACGNE